MIALLIAGRRRRCRCRWSAPASSSAICSRTVGASRSSASEDRGPEHQHKAGTPTMGGIAILGGGVRRLRRRPHPQRRDFSDQALS